MYDGWKRELAWLGGTLLLGGLLGILFEPAWLYLALAMALYAGRHLGYLARLTHLLLEKKKLQTPFPRGPWGLVYNEISRLQSGSRKRKRRLARFLTRFREAVTALPDAAIILGKEGHIEWANPSAERLLGVVWPQMGGRALLHIARHPILEEYLSEGDFRRPLELPSPVNKALVLSLRITPFGRKHQRLLVARDITRIYHLDKIRRDFVSNISHELRTPLTVISGFLENLSDSQAECPQWGRSLELMREQATRMQALIDDLLTLSRLEMAEEQPTEETTVTVGPLLSSIVHDARILSGDAEHDIELEANSSLALKGNHQELRGVFSNLIFNAVRHTPGRTSVRVSWNVDEAGAVFVVSDTGEGIPARHVPRLTERFYRVDTGRSRESGGTGLGLAIVKHALNRYGAKLEIASEEGNGSTFTCRFPADRVVKLPSSDLPRVSN